MCMTDKHERERGPVGLDALLNLLTCKDELLFNREIVDALGMVSARGNHSLTGHWRDAGEFLADDSKKVRIGARGYNGALVRGYTKRGVVKIALRSRTDVAHRFQRLAADVVARAIEHPDFTDLFKG